MSVTEWVYRIGVQARDAEISKACGSSVLQTETFADARVDAQILGSEKGRVFLREIAGQLRNKAEQTDSQFRRVTYRTYAEGFEAMVDTLT